MHTSTRWPIHWVQTKRGMLAICGKTHRIMRTNTSHLDVLVVNDFYVRDNDSSCEEGQRCVNTQCPLNETTVKTLMAAYGLKKRPAWMTEIKPVEVDADVEEYLDKLCQDNPTKSVVVMSTNGKGVLAKTRGPGQS